jgi:hypothetical protein
MARPDVYLDLEYPGSEIPVGTKASLKLKSRGELGISDAGPVVLGFEPNKTLTGSRITWEDVRPNVGSSGDQIIDPPESCYELTLEAPGRPPSPPLYILVTDSAGPLNAAELKLDTATPTPGVGALIKGWLISEGFQEGQQGIQGDPGLVVDFLGEDTSAPRPSTDGAWFPVTYGDVAANAVEGDVALVLGDSVPPDVPTGVTTRPLPEAAEVGFAQPPGAAGFEARVGLLNPPTDGSAVAGTSPIIVDGLTNGSTYYAQARSMNNAGFVSPWSTPAVSVVPSPAPAIRQVAAAGIQSADVEAIFEEPTLAGSLLVAFYARGIAGAGLGVETPSGWTLGASQDESTRHRMLAFWRESTGQSSVLVHATQGGPRCDLIVVELIGAAVSSPFDIVDTDASFDAGSMNLTGSTTVANTQVLACWSLKHETGAGISASWTGSPTNDFLVADEVTGRMRVASREKLPASGLSTEQAWSNDDASAVGMFIGIKPA